MYYRHIYFQAIDAAIVTIRDRFNQGDYTIYANLEQVILLAAKNENYSNEHEDVVDLYGDDFNKLELETQLGSIQPNGSCSLYEFRYFQGCSQISAIPTNFPACTYISSCPPGETCAAYASNQCSF